MSEKRRSLCQIHGYDTDTIERRANSSGEFFQWVDDNTRLLQEARISLAAGAMNQPTYLLHDPR